MFTTLAWVSSVSKVPRIVQISVGLYKNSKAIVNYCVEKMAQLDQQKTQLIHQVQSVIQNLIVFDQIQTNKILFSMENLISDQNKHCYLAVDNRNTL